MQDKTGFLYSQNYSYIRSQLDRYRQDKGLVAEDWKAIFDSIGDDRIADVDDDMLLELFFSAKSGGPVAQQAQAGEGALVDAYRSFGGRVAKLDPLQMSDEDYNDYAILRPETYSGGADDSLEQVAVKMRELYCQTRSMEAMHISDHAERQWLFDKYENMSGSVSKEVKLNIHKDMYEAELFEQFLHVKFAGAKRFSIEGGESSMVVLEALAEHLSLCGFDELVIGMPHRGRLNCLVKIVGKPYSYILSEFMDNPTIPDDVGLSGDVKYHLGASVERELRSGKKVVMSLTPNPSHLEAVDTVTMGRTRAKQVLRGDGTDKIASILLHGDSSFAGQGMVYEAFQLSRVPGYSVGGTIHIIVNNQIGFTTERKSYSSVRHPTELAKFIGAPIFHVNGDDPESAYLISQLAAEYRAKFHKDVVINVVCYRKYGHNEGDEPMFTQPLMYKKISSRPSPVAMYEGKLIAEGVMTKEFADERTKEFKDFLAQELSKGETNDSLDWLKKNWEGIVYSAEPFVEVNTSIPPESVSKIAKALMFLPGGFTANQKISKLLEARRASLGGESSLDWGTAEWLAIGSIMSDGYSVRISGQDAIRGTFSHRHAMIYDHENGSVHCMFDGLKTESVRFDVMSSPLSEYGVLGFEYGYSNVSPHNLVIWEAQYGDFANTAQVIFDQFICSSELKWLRMSGLVVLLPHGYEGQGPEHSSARIERYLQLCAENNMRVVNCTTPANYFHALRRQLAANIRKPLIVFSPKSLLRHKLAVSKLAEFVGDGAFRYVIGDDQVQEESVDRVVLCSGKVYYDLYELRAAQKLQNVAIVRVEQLYPLHVGGISAEIAKYKKAKIVVWCQEEPRNAGPWSYIFPYILEIAYASGKNLIYAGRSESAATAVGYHSIHVRQQKQLVADALGCE